MELSSVASAVSNANAAQAAAMASVLLLKKTLDLQSETAIGMIQAIPQVTPPSNPPHLGNSIDVMA